MATERIFRFKAKGPSGATVEDVVSAVDRRAALRRLEQDGLLVININEAAAPGASASALTATFRKRGVTMAQKLILLRQMSLMLRAGVDLLEALETVGVGMGGDVQAGLKEVSVRLRRGERLRDALSQGMPSSRTMSTRWWIWASRRAGLTRCSRTPSSRWSSRTGCSAT